MKSIFFTTLRHLKAGALKPEIIEEHSYAFDNEENLKIWLRNNGFVYGHCDAFKNTPGKFYWFHQKDTATDMVEVEIHEFTVNNAQIDPDDWITKLKYR